MRGQKPLPPGITGTIKSLRLTALQKKELEEKGKVTLIRGNDKVVVRKKLSNQ